MSDLDLTADIINVHDIIARYEELESQMPDGDGARNWPELGEFSDLGDILESLKGKGSDIKYLGCWYPEFLVRARDYQPVIIDGLTYWFRAHK